eukprot:3928273-Prymnesium_polylepis.1
MGKGVMVDPFFLFAGALSANYTIKYLTVKELRKEHVAPLAQALRANKKVETLNLEGSFSSRGVKTDLRIVLPVQDLTGHHPQAVVDLSESGELGRISSDLIGALVCENTDITCLDLSETQAGRIIIAENDGAFIFDSLFTGDMKSPSLQTIHLSSIGLGDIGVKRVFEALVATTYPNLSCLRLDSNEITGGTSAGQAMTNFLQDMQKCQLKILSLNNNTLDSRLLTTIIKTNASLTDIEFAGNDITDFAMRAIAQHLLMPHCLCRLRAIKCNLIEIGQQTDTLDLSGQAADPVVLLLVGAILRHSQSLTAVRLANIQPPFDAEGAKALQVGLKTSSLIELDLQGHALFSGVGGVIATVQMVRHSKALEKVQLVEAPLPVKALSGVDPVAKVDLSSKKLEVVSAQVMAALTSGNRALRDLNLRSNKFGPQGGAVL